MSSYAPPPGPPLAPRPAGNGESGGQSQPGLGAGRGAGLGMVGGVLDRIGTERRKALEQRVDAVTQGKRATIIDP